MRTINKISCIILALLIAVVQLPFSAMAYNENVPSYKAEQTDVKSEDKVWTYDIVLDKNGEQRVWLKHYINPENNINIAGAELIIPSIVDGMRVQSVEFENVIINKGTKIVFEENVERIAGTFLRSRQDLQIELPSSLLMIDADTFGYSKITSINFPEGLCAIGNNAFKSCTFSSGTDIVLPESVEYIGDGAFDNTNITSVKIGAKTNFSPAKFSQTAGAYYESIPEYPCIPFSNCSKLTKFEIDEDNPYFKNANGIIYTADEKELVFMNSNPSDYAIPDSVEYVCSGALNNKTFDSFFIPSTIQNFSDITFSGTTIGKLSFAEDCTYESISTKNFKNSKIDEITIPKSVKTIANDAFYKCGIKKLTFEEGSELSEIGARAFKSNDLEMLDLTPCKLLIKAQEEAFCGNKHMTSVDMTDVPLDALSTMMFCHCFDLKEFKLSKYTKTIGTEAFEYDSELEAIDLSNIAQVYSMAFRNCDKINVDDYILSSGTTEDGYEYNEFENHVSLIGYSGESNELVMPDTINGKPVTDIVWWGNWVLHDQYIQSVQFPENLEFISSKAFQNKKVQEISDFPETLRYIGAYAFSGCNFKSVKLNDGLEYVLSCAFQFCPLESMNIPDSVLYYSGAMYNTEKSITFGKNVRNIQDVINISNAEFRAKNVYISPENPYYCFENGVLYNKDKTEIYKFYSYYNLLELRLNYQIPDTVKNIDEKAFYECKILRNITIPASVKYIGKNAFAYSNVKSVQFADGFQTDTLDRTFAHCSNLQTATFGDVDVKKLLYTFAGSGVTNVDIPDSVENITGAYEMTDLSSVTELNLPAGLKVLGNWSFGYSYLAIKELHIPKGVESIGYSAFSQCGLLETIDFGNVKFLSRLAFESCNSLESIDLTGIRYIAENHWSGTFNKCSNLKKITYNRTDKTYDIDENANQYNDAIETVVIGNGVRNVKRKAFADCSNLQTAVITDSVESIADDAFDNCDKLTIVCTEQSPAMLYAERNDIKYKTFKVNPVPDQIYTGKAIRPQLSVTVGANELKAGEDYDVSYTDNIKIGTARAIAVGLGDYSIYAATVKFNIVAHQHQYKVSTVKPTYAAKGYTLHTCTVCGHSYKTDYTAKLTVPKTSVSKLTKKKKAFTVKWKKVSAATGYQLQYSTSKNFKSKKTVTVKGAKNVTKTVKKLKSKKRYYVRVRAYKTYNGKNYYSDWSAAKNVKTK